MVLDKQMIRKPKFMTRRNSKVNKYFDLENLDIDIKAPNIIEGTSSFDQ